MPPSAAGSKLGVSAFVVCCNEERRIRHCLDSVAWCDEIVIVDSGSTDKTVEICKEYTDRIFQRPWPGFVEQKRFALEQCRSEWVLNLDADEEVSAELAAEIKTVLSSGSPDIDGYQLLRVVFFLGKWWRRGGWYPEYRLRLCRKSRTQWGGEDPHEKAIVSGKTARLSGELHHYTYADLEYQVRSLNNLSTAAAKTMHGHGERSSAFKIFARPIARFLKFYVLKKGFLEGFPGLVVASLESVYVFLKYAKLWELERATRSRERS
jgi:glycosyltransferase involved in cell wall biosynthesis